MLNRFTKYWNDPVLSKVIAAGIITFSGFILIKIKGIFFEIPFREGIQSVVNYLHEDSSINNGAILLASILLLAIIIIYLLKLYKLFSVKKLVKKDNDQELPFLDFGNSAAFFTYRLGKAFPGVRGLEWFTDSNEAVKRLTLLLKEPLIFGVYGENGSWTTPIWWFRELAGNNIKSFIPLKSSLFKNTNKVLMNVSELNIDKIAIYKSPNYYHSFIYVEVKPSRQTGLNKISEKDILESIKSFGYSWEEFASINGKPIKREEYDDGAAIINGKLVEIQEAKLRVRYLTRYNFVIAANESAFNTRGFEAKNQGLLTSILKGEKKLEELIEKVNACSKSEILRYG